MNFKSVSPKIPFNWPNKKLSLYDALSLIEVSAHEPFSFSWIKEEIKQHCFCYNHDPEEHLKSILNQSTTLGVIHGPDPLYVPGKLLFEKKKFRILPTQKEIELGILIPGHRFYPWLSVFVSPDEINLFWRNIKFTETKYKNTMEELQYYYHLLPDEDTFCVIHPVINREDKPQYIYTTPALNLSEFYDFYNFKHGDELLIEVDDFYEGNTKIRFYPREAVLRKFLKTIDRDRAIVHEISQYIEDTGEQPQPIKALLDAYTRLQSKGSLPHGIQSSWPIVLYESKRIFIYRSQSCPYLVLKKQSRQEIAFNINHQMLFHDGRCETLDDLFVTGNCELDEVILKAYILDNLTKKSHPKEKLFEKVFHLFPIQFSNEKYKNLLSRFYYDLFSLISEDACAILRNRKQNQIRKKTLNVMESLQEIQKEMDLPVEDDIYADLDFLGIEIHNLLGILGYPLNSGDLKHLFYQINEIENTLQDFQKKLIGKLNNSPD